MKHKAKLILYVDDDPDDREFLSYAFKTISPETKVVLAEDGVKALDYLNSTEAHKVGLPCLIVLDLNMPYLDGRETYQRIQTNPALQNIPTIVFTSSLNPHDKAFFNSLGIELITKPDNIAYMNKIASHMLQACA